MSFTDDFLKALNKQGVSISTGNAGKSAGTITGADDFTKSYLSALDQEEEKKKKKKGIEDIFDDIAPIRTVGTLSGSAPKKDDSKLDFFQKGSFEDGYQFGDVSKAILGTAGDVGLNALKGVWGIGEGIGDLAAYGIAGIADLAGKDEYADDVRKRAQVNLGDKYTKGAQDYLDKYSVLGRTSDAIMQGVGQVAGIMATGGLGSAAGLGSAGATALTTGVMGLSGMGSGIGEAYQRGATDEEAAIYGAISGGADALSEMIFGGLGKTINAVGFSKGLSSADDMLAKKVSSMFSNQIMKNISEFGIKASAEGVEEVLAGTAQAIGKKLTYMDEEKLSTILADENLLEQFVVGAVTSGIAQAPSLHIANTSKTDFVTGQTQNEQAVVKKEVENRIAEAEQDGKKLTAKEKAAIEAQVEKDLEKGYISTDTIEEVLGGEDYQRYKQTVDSETALEDKRKAFQEEFDTLNKMKQGEMTGEQIDRRADLKEELAKLNETIESTKNHSPRELLKQRLSDSVSEMVRSDRLIESYNERSRRGQAFEADLSKYNAKQRAVVQKAVESGILNNTNRTHEFVDMVAKISADKGVLFDFTNNERLKESGFAVDGKTVNGYVTKDGVTLNIQSAKSLNSVVGHEITHVLEGTEIYTELQSILTQYAKNKGDYQGRYDALAKMYEGVEGANIDNELTADLVGDYLFTDSDFINNLSTNHRNVFQKIYDEIKYLCKVATAGSKEARELEKVKRAFDKAYRETGKSEGDTKYSLTSEQQEYFKDSKVRDENGNLKVMYHGTPNGDFTVFKDGTYFTENKEYADIYQNPGASSISSGKVASNPKTFEVYLDIKKPFDLGDAEARNIYINDYIKGGNAMGINPYLSDAEYDKITSIDWTEGEDLREFLIDNGYDYDGLVLDEGATGGYGDEVKSRGKSYVVFSPEQVKNIDNLKPTADKDIRFSLSESVEETKDLMALHNLHSSELLKQLKMGGMAYPSIAITKPEMFSHDGFGEVSVILHKDAIDPKKSKYNKIYSADAYTPTFPNVEYEASEQVAANITRKVNELYDKLPEYYQRSLRSLRDYTNIDDQLNRWGGEQRLVEKYADDYAMKQLYLAEKGEAVSVEKKTMETKMTDYQMKLYRTVADTIGEDALKSFNEKGSFEKLGLARMAWLEKHGDELKNIYAEDWSSDGTMTKEEALEIANEQKPIYWKGEIDRALAFIKTGGVTVTETDDIGTTQTKIDEKIAGSDYKKWVDNLFSGIEGRSGIRNSKDLFTPSGNRRSFAQTHDPLTIDNIVKAMRKENQTGQGAFGGGSILGASAKEFGSIAEVKKNSGKLGMMDKAEHDAITDKINDTFWDIARRYANGKDIIDAQETIAEAVSKNESKAGIARYLKQYDYVYKYTDSIGDEIIELRDYIRSLPTPYFEAKPRRGVGFDEVGAFVIPYDADVKLKQELLNRGYAIAEYDPKVEGDRQRVVNQFEEYKFSLSNVGETPKVYGSYNTYGKDIALETAPVAENATTEEANATNASHNATPVLSNADNATVSKEEMVEMFPDEPTPQMELDNLNQEKEALEGRMMDMANNGDFTEFASVNDRYTAVQTRIAELENEISETESQRVDSISDTDVPPEMDAPYYGEPSEPENVPDPFADRDMHEVGSQKVKAYQYENPEVKPYFTEAAYGMLDDLNRSNKGEKIFNGDVYYNSGGEHGWMGTKRNTTSDIAALLDQWHYTYAEIEKGINAIIEDNVKENNAVSKRIEFMLHDRLVNGYTDVWGEQFPPNQEYIDFLQEKKITEYSKEAFDAFMAKADQYAPAMDAEDIGPTPDAEKTSATKDKAYESIRPKPKKKVKPEPMADDYGPTRPRMVRVDSNNGRPGEKQRKWVGTSTESEAVNRQILPDDLDQKKIYYQPISNKVTLGKANARLDSNGYEASVTYFNGRFADKKISLDDIALGERLIQEAIKKGDTKTAGELIQNVAILGTELGQKVQALSIIQRMTPEGQLKMLQKTVDRGNAKGDKAYEGVVITQEMIDKILSSYGKDGSYDQMFLNRMVEDVKKQIADQMKVTAADKMNAWRYLSMLGNPKTHIRNIVSNVAMRGTVGAKNIVARTAESIVRPENRTKTWAAPTEYVKSYAQKTALEMKDIISGGGKYSEDASIKEMRNIFKNKVLNGVYEFNSEWLEKEDWWFSKPAFTNALSEYLTANGIKTHADIKKNPKIVEKARLYATEQAQIATFRQYSWLANKLNEMERQNAVANFATGSIMPFKKTPINIAKTGLNYSPLGFAKTLTYDISQVKKGNMEASQLIDNLAQNLTGTALTLAGFMLANAGLLSGGGDDDKEGKYDYQLGQQAYSVNIGGKAYSLSWLSPVSMPLFVGANAYEQLVEGKEWNGDVVIETLAQTLDPLSEMSFLSGLDTVLSSYDSGIQKFAAIGESMAQNYVTQFAPTFMGQIATVMDDTKRSTKASADSDFTFVEETINKLKYKIPGLRQTLEPTLDIWGNEVKQTEDKITRAVETFLAPYALRESNVTAIDEEIKALYRESGENGVIPKTPYSYIVFKDNKYEMSAKDHTNFKKTYGQLSYETLQDLFATETYKNATASDKADLVEKVYAYAQDEAKREFLAKRGVNYTNATKKDDNGEDVPYYKVDAIKGAIEMDVTPEEYTYSVQNPDKYNFLKSIGVSYSEFASSDKETKDAYQWAYQNPDKHTMSKAITGDFVTYYKYNGEIADIKEKNDSSSGITDKSLVTEYINNLDIDYGQKIILYRSMYSSKKDRAAYNADIVEYLNSRDDISYDEMVTILKELDFTVTEDGTVYWN